MTLEEFLNYPFTSDFKILNKVKDLNNISVDFISILEPPAGTFVRSNEIVLSAAFAIKDNPIALHDFIYSVYQMEASGIVLSFPENDFHILDSMLDEFSSYNFPIMSMDYYHLFQDVVESTLKEIWNRNSAYINTLESLQRALLSYFIHDNSMDDVADLISGMLKTDVIIMEQSHRILGRNETIRNLSPKGILENRTSEIFRLEIKSHGHTVGLIILDENSHTVLLQNEEYVQYLLTPISLWFDKAYSILSLKVKEKEEFIINLSNGNYKSSDEIHSLANGLDFNSTIYYCCFVGDVSVLSSFEDFLQESIIAAAHTLQLEVMNVCHRKRCIIFLECHGASMSPMAAEEFLDYIENRVKDQLPLTNFIWGYDLKATPIEKLSLSYKNSMESLNICMESNGAIKRYCASQSMINKVKTLLSNDAEIMIGAQRVLEPLLHIDSEKSTEYVKTLKQYINSNYNVTVAAQNLSIHRQTMIYRLSKIEDLCHISLDNHEDLLLFEISLLTYT